MQDGHQRLGQLLNLDSLLAGVDAEANNETIEKTQARDEDDDHNGKQKENDEEEDEEQEFEFRLFSVPAAGHMSAAPTADVKDGAQRGDDQAKSSSNSKETTQKLRIRLRSPTPGPADLSEGRFLKPFVRGWEYYFTAPGLLTGSEDAGAEQATLELKRRQFEEVAVTGQNVMEWASVPWVSSFFSILVH